MPVAAIIGVAPSPASLPRVAWWRRRPVADGSREVARRSSPGRTPPAACFPRTRTSPCRCRSGCRHRTESRRTKDVSPRPSGLRRPPAVPSPSGPVQTGAGPLGMVEVRCGAVAGRWIEERRGDSERHVLGKFSVVDHVAMPGAGSDSISSSMSSRRIRKSCHSDGQKPRTTSRLWASRHCLASVTRRPTPRLVMYCT